MAKWIRRSDWVGTQIEDRFVMIHIESGRYVALNETASEAWRVLETAQDSESLTSALMEKFEVEEAHCAKSVAQLTETMSKLEMIEPAD
jgi:Coenzyme PQQ synthesis protein D (PqqD)